MLIYGVIATVGLIILILMLVVGEVVDGDHDVGHADVDHGGGPSVLSVRVMAAFVTAFGVGGLVARYYNLSHPAASGVGVVAGIVMAAVVYQFARVLYSQQASTDLTMQGLVGAAAEVSVAIPDGGVGQVSLSLHGERSEHIARSADGRGLARGSAVVITGLGGDAVVVRPTASQDKGGRA